MQQPVSVLMQPFGTHYSVKLCLQEQTALFPLQSVFSRDGTIAENGGGKVVICANPGS